MLVTDVSQVQEKLAYLISDIAEKGGNKWPAMLQPYTQRAIVGFENQTWMKERRGEERELLVFLLSLFHDAVEDATHTYMPLFF